MTNGAPDAGPIVLPTRTGHRRWFSEADKRRIVAEATRPACACSRSGASTASFSGFVHDIEEGSTGVLHQVPVIGHLHGARQRFGRCQRITAKVKAAIFNDPGLKSLQIEVDTFKDVVQLSGFVDSAQARKRAGEVAAGVAGVRSVHNGLVVK